MSKSIMTAAIVLLVLVLAFPLIALFRGGERAHETNELVPSPEEVPPQWDAQGLARTAWEADMRTSPTIKYRDEVLFQYRFLPNNQVTLDIIDTEDPDSGRSEESHVIRQHLRDALMPRFEGIYRVDGSQIILEVEMLGRSREDIIEIRGLNLYYHAVQMNQIDDK